MEKVKINTEIFGNLRRMLKSPDEETVVTAICSMEQMDLQDNKLYMSLLYRESKNSSSLWNTHAPTIVAGIENLKLEDGASIKCIYENLAATASKDEIAAFAVIFEEMSRSLIINWGFGKMVDNFNISITPKENG